MTTLTFSNYPADMTEPGWFGYGAFFPDGAEPVSMTSTEIILVDALSGSTTTMLGSFDYSSEAALLNSLATELIIRTSANELLWDWHGFSLTFQQILQTTDPEMLNAQILSGGDTITGGGGSDYLRGYDGNDLLFGGLGNDTLLGESGNDYLQGNAGDDSLGGGIGNDSVFGGQGNDTLSGGADDDLVRGAFGNDEMRGGLGNDTLLAGQGDDSLYGGLGNDRLYGLLGNDVLTGGDGADVFVFSTPLDAATNLDVITDFQVGVDQIHLDPAIFTALAGQAGTSVGLSQYLTYDSATGLVAYDADGSGPGSAVAFADIGSGLSLGADFFIGV